MDDVETQIESWRAHLRRSRAVTRADVEELEDHLREQMASLGAGGLSRDEAFLVAVKRMGAIDALTREFAREHSERLWKQLVLPIDDGHAAVGSVVGVGARKMWVALALAVAAAVAIKAPALFGIEFEAEGGASSIRSTSVSSPFRSSSRTSRGSDRCRRRAACGWPGSSRWQPSS